MCCEVMMQVYLYTVQYIRFPSTRRVFLNVKLHFGAANRKIKKQRREKENNLHTSIYIENRENKHQKGVKGSKME